MWYTCCNTIVLFEKVSFFLISTISVLAKRQYPNLSESAIIFIPIYLYLISTKIQFYTTATFHIFRAVRIIRYMYREHIINTVSDQFVCTTSREVEIFSVECFVMMLTPRVAQVRFTCRTKKQVKKLLPTRYVLTTYILRKYRNSSCET